MRDVLYHRNAVRYMRRMPADRKEQVKAVIEELSALEDLLAHPNVKSMSGEWRGCLRLRIGSYRAWLPRLFPSAERFAFEESVEVFVLREHLVDDASDYTNQLARQSRSFPITFNTTWPVLGPIGSL